MPKDLTDAQRTLLLEQDIKSFKYSEDQERDDHGRWTSGGGREEVVAQFDRFHDAMRLTDSAFEPMLGKIAQWRMDLDQFETNAISVWKTGSGFDLINGVLRGEPTGVIETQAAENLTAQLDKAIEKAPELPEDSVVYRAFATEQFGELHVGDVISDTGFVATAADGSFLTSFGQFWENANQEVGPTSSAEILLPAGTHAAMMSNNELLIPRDSSFRVVSVQPISADYTPPGGVPGTHYPGLPGLGGDRVLLELIPRAD
jgi:ADP-ribosyltransferase exoenzyme